MPDTIWSVDDSMYNDYTDRWECPYCDRPFTQSKALLQHLSSGAHEASRYECSDCPKEFKSMSSLIQHLNASGHSRKKERLVHTLLSDARRAGTLMLTDGRERLGWEATLFFDGGARPNPGAAGSGWWLKDDRGYNIAEGGEPVRLGRIKKVTVTELILMYRRVHINYIFEMLIL